MPSVHWINDDEHSSTATLHDERVLWRQWWALRSRHR